MVLIIGTIAWLAPPLRAGKGIVPVATPQAEPQRAAVARPAGTGAEPGVMAGTASAGEKWEPLLVQPGLDLVLASPAAYPDANAPTNGQQGLADDDFADLVSSDSAQCQAEEANQYPDQGYYAQCMASRGW